VIVYTEGWLSAAMNILLFGLKIWVGLVTGSIAMIADAWHTLSDTVTSAIVLISFKISEKPKDHEHPFGHGRAEQIGAIIIGTLLIVVGLSFFKDSILRLVTRRSLTYGPLIIGVSVLSLIFKELMAQFAIRAGKKINSQTLIADGWHHRSDAATSLIIIIGAYFTRFFWFTDSLLGIMISFTIMFMAYKVIKKSSSTILGVCSNNDLEDKIQVIIDEVTPVASRLHHVHMHSYGDHTEITFHVHLPGDYSLEKAHDIATIIEDRIRDELKIEPTIHMEPHKKNNS